MKKVLGSIAIFALALPLGAQAADLPAVPYPYKVPVVSAPPVFVWTGCYVGLHAGGDWSKLTITDVAKFALNGVAGQTFSPNDTTGFFGGGQAGCNYQFGMFVAGIEGDIGWMGVKQSALDPGTVSNTTVGINDGLYWDITARWGVAFGPALLYAKGGWASFNGKESFSTLSSKFISNSDVSTFNGWVAGAGVEYMFARNWSAKIEYLHFDFGSQTFNVLAPGTAPFNEKLTVDTVKVGVNYQFNWGDPMVASY